MYRDCVPHNTRYQRPIAEGGLLPLCPAYVTSWVSSQPLYQTGCWAKQTFFSDVLIVGFVAFSEFHVFSFNSFQLLYSWLRGMFPPPPHHHHSHTIILICTISSHLFMPVNITHTLPGSPDDTVTVWDEFIIVNYLVLLLKWHGFQNSSVVSFF